VKKILYSAKDIDGKSLQGFIDAVSNKDALSRLHDKGMTEVVFYDDEVTALQRDDLNGLSNSELEDIAKFELSLREHPGFGHFMLEVFRMSRVFVIVGGSLMIWGMASGRGWMIALGAAIAMTIPCLSIWNYRHTRHYDQLLRAFARGDWDAVSQQASRLSPVMPSPDMKFDLVVKHATGLAAQGELESAVAEMTAWQHELEAPSPGIYEARLANVYFAAGDSERFLALLREAYEKSSHSPTMVLDLALAEARLGDVGKALVVFKQLSLDELPVYGKPFIDWTKGMIAFREHRSNAAELLLKAVMGFMEYANNPAIWPSWAVCVADYTMLSPASEKNKALLQPLWPYIRVHAEASTVNNLQEKYPSLDD
tara:strand:- start:6593 stop:7699 length:1107 start_codon:yes stop_codon:yes gene_type:complete